MTTPRSATPRPAQAAVPSGAAPAPSGPLAAPASQPVHMAAPLDGQADKPKKVKLVRDSFTMPRDEYAAIALLKQRAARLGRTARKSELLRAGLATLAALTDAEFAACMAALPAPRASRPAKA